MFTLSAQNIEKGHVDQMLDSMVQQGIINQGDAEKARTKLNTMSENEWKSINAQANIMAQKYKDRNKDVDLNAQSAAKNINFDGAMFKDIQDSVKAHMETTKNDKQEQEE